MARIGLGLFLGFLAATFPLGLSAQTGPEEVLSAMKKATRFMMEEVSNRGGFLWVYDQDLKGYGELPGRPSMVWVEPPGTPTVGMVLLEAYRVTGEDYYLDRCKEVANVLVRGQHPSGGWHYFIDLDPTGTQHYYDTFFSKCWGWQEYLHYYGNCTFDDFVTSDPTRFFLRLHTQTLDPVYKEILDKALDHILRAQFTNGAWPQRFPLNTEHPTSGHPDYTACYTFNDGVMGDTIRLLLEAFEALGQERLREAAVRGMDFYILSQLPTPQAGWAQQYDHDMRPAWGRPFEMPAVCSNQTTENIEDLLYYYQATGDRRYLEPIPKALDWLESAIISDATDHTHSGFYELGSNRPLYTKRTGTVIADVSFETVYEREGAYPYAPKVTISIDSLKKKYNEIAALSPEQARERYTKDAMRAPAVPPHGYYYYRAYQATAPDEEGIRKILESQDDRGGWLEPIAVADPYAPFDRPGLEFEGYSTGGYAARMARMLEFLQP
jgi:hypothetical protein